MKHVPQDKYNVAWFTLAECVARGEKVRALGVYRLLAHSIDDIAFRRQLEGDIHLAFQDVDDAIDKYKQAAGLYQQNGKFLEAVAVYEHICYLSQDKSVYYTTMILLYSQLSMTSKVVVYLKLLYQELLMRFDIDMAEQTLTQLDLLLGIGPLAHEYQQMVFALLRDELHEPARALHHIQLAVKSFLQCDDSRGLQKFVATLEALNPDYAQKAYGFARQE